MFHDDDDGVITTLSENTLFVEHEKVRRLISVLTTSSCTSTAAATNRTTTTTANTDQQQRDDALLQLRIIFDKYLECPSLLDGHVEDIVTDLTTSARLYLIKQRNRDHSNIGKDTNCCGQTVLPYVLSALYALAKVRGRKRIRQFFPHDVTDVESVFCTLQSLVEVTPPSGREERDSERPLTRSTSGEGRPQPWESIYVLWIWMDMLSLVPFDCNVFFSSSLNDNNNNNLLLSSLVEMAKLHLCHAGPIREAASSCLASWLNRHNTKKGHSENELTSFLTWSRDVLEEYQQQQQSSSSSSPTTTSNSYNGQQVKVVLVMGIMETLVKLLKGSTTITTTTTTATTMDDGVHVQMESLHLWDTILHMANVEMSKSNIKNSLLLLRRLFVKWFARMACAYLPRNSSFAASSWRYQRGRRCLLDNIMAQSKSKASSQSSVVAVKESMITTNHDNNNDDDDDSTTHLALLPVVDQVEDAMGMVLSSLTDSSTIVRWSAAKGVGRITERLPALCAHDVLDYILELLRRHPEQDHAWHGACLALAELARRGLLLPSRLTDVVPLIIKAIQFDVRRGPTSVGANVRDAACYTYWAFARAYAPSILKPFVPDLSRSIVLTFLFDREVNCRRAASAAFQECVGRQGADNFKHGISILTTADYYSLGNINHAFTSVALHVAQFQEYQSHIIDHLFMTKLAHWDIKVRILASKSLHGVTPLNPDRMRNLVVPALVERGINESLFVRHGAVLGLAEVMLALAKIEASSIGTKFDEFDKDALDSIVDLVPRIEKARLYRGRGGEIMRSAVCRLIECISQACVPLTVKQQVRYLDSIDACLKHPNEDIQEAASNALCFLMRNYFPVGKNGPSDRLQNRVVDKYVHIVRTSLNPAETRGFSLALGSLPSKLLSPSIPVMSSVLGCLCSVAKYDSKVGTEADAETRRNALLSLTRVCETVGIGGRSNTVYPTVGLTSDMLDAVFNALLSSLEGDYNTDRRGDVGSWSRVAAMSGLESLTYAAVSCMTLNSDLQVNGEDHATNTRDWFDESRCIRVIGGLLKQFSEKLDSVRSHAGECLSRVLTSTSPVVPLVPSKNHLLESLQLKQGDGPVEITNWANPASTYRLAMAAADVDAFFPYVISGIIISVGGLGESVSRYSEEALLAWIRSRPTSENDDRASRIANELVRLFRYNHRRNRIILPLLKTLDKLLDRGCLNGLIHVKESAFCVDLLECMMTEAKGCNNVHTLLAIVGVSLGLLSSKHEQTLNDEILVFLCQMLYHRFPRVRRITADNFYVRLLEENDIIGRRHADLDSVLGILLEAPWDSDMTVQESHELSSRVAQMIGVTVTAPPKLGTVGAPRRRDGGLDEFASYASLVNSS